MRSLSDAPEDKPRGLCPSPRRGDRDVAAAAAKRSGPSAPPAPPPLTLIVSIPLHPDRTGGEIAAADRSGAGSEVRGQGAGVGTQGAPQSLSPARRLPPLEEAVSH